MIMSNVCTRRNIFPANIEDLRLPLLDRQVEIYAKSLGLYIVGNVVAEKERVGIITSVAKPRLDLTALKIVCGDELQTKAS